jgi:ribosomal protein S18 acetylase RimI-like enzyme
VPQHELVVPEVADAGRIAAVINDRSRALRGITEESADGVARWFALPTLDPEADMRLAVDENGEGEGYADVGGPDEGGPKAWVDLRVRPGCTAAREMLFAWAEGRGAERAGPGGVIQYFADERDEELRALLAEAGYTVVRSSYEMERSLAGELERPVWPERLDARPFDLPDAEAVHAAHEEAFSDHWDYEPGTFDSWRAWNLAETEDTSLWTIAWDGDEVAGLCLNRPSRGEDDTVGWVGVLAVRRPWRRRGLGEALLRDAFSTFAARGKRSVGLGVDAENTTNAVALYERVGMHAARRSDTWERRV